MLEGSITPKKYIIKLSGTVFNERFSDTTMTLQISGTATGDQNPYLVIAAGFPDPQTRNAFFWNSQQSTMQVNANTITCAIRPAFPSRDICFYHVSPALIRRKNFTHRDDENARHALKMAAPTMVPARAGELTLTLSPNSVSGTVWLQGYDPIEKSFVRYSAGFTGMPITHTDQRTQRTYR